MMLYYVIWPLFSTGTAQRLQHSKICYWTLQLEGHAEERRNQTPHCPNQCGCASRRVGDILQVASPPPAPILIIVRIC